MPQLVNIAISLFYFFLEKKKQTRCFPHVARESHSFVSSGVRMELITNPTVPTDWIRVNIGSSLIWGTSGQEDAPVSNTGDSDNFALYNQIIGSPQIGFTILSLQHPQPCPLNTLGHVEINMLKTFQ